MRRYRGHAAHFIDAPACLFHIATEIHLPGADGTLKPAFIVSSVGDYRPQHHRKGDALGPKTRIGADRYYETFVWCVDANLRTFGDPFDALGYDTETEAEAGHEAKCAQYEGLGADKLRALYQQQRARQKEKEGAR